MKKSDLTMAVHLAKMTLFNIVIHRRINLPSSIGMETSLACNRRCSYCPQSVSPHKQEIVKDEMWELFISRLKELRWKGAVAPTAYNEPSLAPKHAQYIADLKEAGCRPITFTNGDRPKAIQQWVDAGIFRVIVTEHPPYKPGWWDHIQPLVDKYPKIVRAKRLEWVHNQAGAVEGDKIDNCFSAHGLSVKINGKVSMCCLDYESQYPVGDITKNSLQEIWDSPLHREIRRKVIRGIPATELCKNCLNPK
jgi:radical SAM protein with 4Fe4S-binding SPASM domain